MRVDHSEYTAEQLMRHELGHDMIAKGEVDPNEVRRELEKNYTPEQIKYVMQAYTELYAGSNLEPDEIWEEIICDSLGDMNAFSETYYGEKIEKFLLSAKTAARERGKAQQNARENAVPTAAQLRAERKKAEQAELEERHEKWLNGELSDEEYFGGEDALPFSRETRFSYEGKNKNGVEVYETSEETQNLTAREKKQKFLDLMKNEYRGRTAKFTRGGEVYYAQFDKAGLNKNVYGDNKSSIGGRKAKMNVGADGNIFELVENARYSGSSAEQGKAGKAHTSGQTWGYFVKTVQIDGQVYDLLANVRRNRNGEFVYNIQLNENNTQEAAPHRGTSPANGTAFLEAEGTASSGATIPENGENVKTKFSREVRARDAEYLKAVNSGEMDTAQPDVDEAAKERGYSFFRRTRHSGRAYNDVPWMMFANDDEPIQVYGENLYVGNANDATNVSTLTDEIKELIYNEFDISVADEEIDPPDIVMSAGMWDNADMVQAVWDNILEPRGIVAITTEDGMIAFEQDGIVKSADPVTYDSKGEPIPLSERFNLDNEDIRYSRELKTASELREVRARAAEDYKKPISTSDIETLRSIGRKSINDFTSEDIQKTQKWAYKFYQELGTKSPFFRAWFGDWRANDTGTVEVVDAVNREGKNPRGSFVNKDTGWSITSSSVGYYETVSHAERRKASVIASQNIDKIIENAMLS